MNSGFQIAELVFLIFAGLFFVLSVVLFFVLEMTKVIGDLTGHTAKREIENIRAQNQQSGRKVFKSSKVNIERGKITDKISSSGHVIKSPSHSMGGSVGTEKIGSPVNNTGYENTTLLEQETSLLNGDDNDYSAETSLLGSSASEETSLLTGDAYYSGTEETSLLSENDYDTGSAETSVLSSEANVATQGTGYESADETTLLNTSDGPETSLLNEQIFTAEVYLLQEIKYVHTDEIV